MFDEKIKYVIMKDADTFLKIESSDIYDIYVSLTSLLENASFLSIDGARTVISELTGVSSSKYHYHAKAGYESVVNFNPGDLIIVRVTFTPVAISE